LSIAFHFYWRKTQCISYRYLGAAEKRKIPPLVLALRYRPWKFKRQNFTVHPEGVEGVIGRMPLIVMFTLERIDPPAINGPPPQGGNFPPLIIHEVLLLKNFKDCF